MYEKKKGRNGVLYRMSVPKLNEMKPAITAINIEKTILNNKTGDFLV
jgi:hypothetical protein